MIAMNGHQTTNETSQLTPKQARLIELLTGGSTIVAAAKTLQINESTCRRWLKLPHVDQAYTAAKDNLFREVLVGLEKRAVAALQKHLLAQVDVTAASQIKAVGIILEMKLQALELATIMSKIATLEQIQQQGDDLYS